MSDVADPVRPGIPAEWERLELAVRRLLDRSEAWRARALEAERRAAELESALAELRAGPLDPLALAERVEAVEAENARLRQRLASARETVGRIRGRLEFLRGAR